MWHERIVQVHVSKRPLLNTSLLQTSLTVSVVFPNFVYLVLVAKKCPCAPFPLNVLILQHSYYQKAFS